MNRRSFIGSLLGTLVTSQLPFKTVLWDAPLQTERIVPYKMLVWDVLTQCFIQVPGIKEIKESDHKIQFVGERLDIQRVLKISHCALIDDQGKLISYGKYPSEVNMCSGDSLNSTYTISHDSRTHIPLKVIISRSVDKNHSHIEDLSANLRH